MRQTMMLTTKHIKKINNKENFRAPNNWPFLGGIRWLTVDCILKRKSLHFDEMFITGCTGSCQNDNFQCSQWWKFRQNDDIFVSVIYHKRLGGWGCDVSCGGHHRQRGKTTAGSALDGAVLDFTQILAYLVHNMSRSQLYLGFGHFVWPSSFFQAITICWVYG